MNDTTTVYVRELLLDLTQGRVSQQLRIELVSAITECLRSKQITRQTIRWLDRYLSGYTATEIAQQYRTTPAHIESALSAALRAIAHESGYTDAVLLQMVRSRMRARYHYAQQLLRSLTTDYSHAPLPIRR